MAEQRNDVIDGVTPRRHRSRLACATHELIGVIGDRWSVLILIELGDNGLVRRADLRRAIDGISDKVLTTCLRRLESRGFVRREVDASAAVSVSYGMTDLGQSFFGAFSVLRQWADDHVDELDPAVTSDRGPQP